MEEHALDKNPAFFKNLSGLPYIENLDKAGLIGSGTLPIIDIVDVQTDDLTIDFSIIVHVPHKLKRICQVYGRYKNISDEKWQTFPAIIATSNAGILSQQFVEIHEITNTEVLINFWNVSIPDRIQLFFVDFSISI